MREEKKIKTLEKGLNVTDLNVGDVVLHGEIKEYVSYMEHQAMNTWRRKDNGIILITRRIYDGIIIDDPSLWLSSRRLGKDYIPYADSQMKGAGI
jgi:hypothetical protein